MEKYYLKSGFLLVLILICAPAQAAPSKASILRDSCAELVKHINSAGTLDDPSREPNRHNEYNRAINPDAQLNWTHIRSTFSTAEAPVHLPTTLDSFSRPLAYLARLASPQDPKAGLDFVYQKISAVSGNLESGTVHSWILGTANPRVSLQPEILGVLEKEIHKRQKALREQAKQYPQIANLFDRNAYTRSSDMGDVLHRMEELLSPKRVADILGVKHDFYATYSARMNNPHGLGAPNLSHRHSRRNQEFSFNFRNEELDKLYAYLVSDAGRAELRRKLPPHTLQSTPHGVIAVFETTTAQSPSPSPTLIGKLSDDALMEDLEAALVTNKVDGDALFHSLLKKSGGDPAKVPDDLKIGMIDANHALDLIFKDPNPDGSYDGDAILQTLNTLRPRPASVEDAPQLAAIPLNTPPRRRPSARKKTSRAPVVHFSGPAVRVDLSNLANLKITELRNGDVAHDFGVWVNEEIKLAQTLRTFGKGNLSPERLLSLMHERQLLTEMNLEQLVQVLEGKAQPLLPSTTKAFESFFSESNPPGGFTWMQYRWPRDLASDSAADLRYWIQSKMNDHEWNSEDLWQKYKINYVDTEMTQITKEEFIKWVESTEAPRLSLEETLRLSFLFNAYPKPADWRPANLRPGR